MALGPIGNQEEGKKFRKEREEKEERSRGKKLKTQKGGKKMEPPMKATFLDAPETVVCT